MAEEIEFIDVDLAIGTTSGGQEVKATPYFEDYLYKIIQTFGGEGSTIINDTTNLLSQENNLALSQIADLKKRVDGLTQLTEDDKWKAHVSEIYKQIDALEQLQNQVYPQISYFEREVSRLDQLRDDNSLLLARVNNLLRDNTVLAQLIAETDGAIGQLYALVGQTSNLVNRDYAEVDNTYSAKITDRVIYCDATLGDFTVTLPDPTLALGQMTVMNVTGSASTITVATAAGTIQTTTSVTDGVAAVYEPRHSATEWRDT